MDRGDESTEEKDGEYEAHDPETAARPGGEATSADAANVLAKACQALGQPIPDVDSPHAMLQEALASWDVSKLRENEVS